MASCFFQDVPSLKRSRVVRWVLSGTNFFSKRGPIAAKPEREVCNDVHVEFHTCRSPEFRCHPVIVSHNLVFTSTVTVLAPGFALKSDY